MAHYAKYLTLTRSITVAKLFATVYHQQRLDLVRSNVAMVSYSSKLSTHFPFRLVISTYVLLTCVASFFFCSWIWGGEHTQMLGEVSRLRIVSGQAKKKVAGL